MTPTQHLAAFETEADILSLMLCKPDQSIPKVRAELVADDFFRQTHRVLYACLLEMYQEHEVIDITTVVPYLQSKGKLDAVGGVKAVSYIYSKALGVGALGSYMATVKERARRRKAIELMDVAISQAADLGEELDLHSLQSDMAKVASERYMAERTMKDMTLDFLTRLEERSHEDPGAFCVMSGLNNLDMLIHGFRKQELIYIAGRPSMGKSALAILIAVNAALRQDKDVLYVSLEMGEDQLLGRAIAGLSMVPSERIMYDPGLVNSEDYTRVLAAATELSKAGLHIRTRNVSRPQDIYNQAQQIAGKHGLDAIIIDHVHLMESGRAKDGENQNANMTYISRTLKKMALELNVPVIALAQLSRGVESRNDKRTLLSDLRDSGSLEQDADKVLMLYRESYYTGDESNDVVEVLIRKQRDGKLGEARMRFMKQFAYMEPLIMYGRPESKSFEPPL